MDAPPAAKTHLISHSMTPPIPPVIDISPSSDVDAGDGPRNADASSHAGCGCCRHCLCTGQCRDALQAVGRAATHHAATAPAATSSNSRSNSNSNSRGPQQQLSLPAAAPHTRERRSSAQSRKSHLLSAIESLPHPNDTIGKKGGSGISRSPSPKAESSSGGGGGSIPALTSGSCSHEYTNTNEPATPPMIAATRVESPSLLSLSEENVGKFVSRHHSPTLQQVHHAAATGAKLAAARDNASPRPQASEEPEVAQKKMENTDVDTQYLVSSRDAQISQQQAKTRQEHRRTSSDAALLAHRKGDYEHERRLHRQHHSRRHQDDHNRRREKVSERHGDRAACPITPELGTFNRPRFREEPNARSSHEHKIPNSNHGYETGSEAASSSETCEKPPKHSKSSVRTSPRFTETQDAASPPKYDAQSAKSLHRSLGKDNLTVLAPPAVTDAEYRSYDRGFESQSPSPVHEDQIVATTSISLGPLKVTRTSTKKGKGTRVQAKASIPGAGTEQGLPANCSFPPRARPVDPLLDARQERVRQYVEAVAAPAYDELKAKANTAAPQPTMTVPHNTHVKQDCDYGSLYAVKKFTVHHAPPHMPNTLHFLDWSLRNDNNEPLVAYRIQAIENFVAHGAAQHTTQFVPLGEKSSVNDWLLDSHENGAKLRGKLLLAAGVAGPPLFEIDVKRRKVDKFVIRGTKAHSPTFHDILHYGDHNDYRHVYCKAPNGRILKWMLEEHDKLMRLYGRGESDFGKVYAEARMQRRHGHGKKASGGSGGGGTGGGLHNAGNQQSYDHVPHRRHGHGHRQTATKDTQLFFYNPSNIHEQPRTFRGEDPHMDYAYLCATWWCARQTFDESVVVAAHAETELIESIERGPFEIDLLGGV